MSFTWIPFYKEFADKLLKFRYNRTSLLDIIYTNREYFMVNYLHDEDGENDKCKDIDPFTTMGIFNRGISEEKRLDAAKNSRNSFLLKPMFQMIFVGFLS